MSAMRRFTWQDCHWRQIGIADMHGHALHGCKALLRMANAPCLHAGHAEISGQCDHASPDGTNCNLC